MPLFLIRRDVPGAGEEDIRAGIVRAVSCAFNFDGMRWVTSYWDSQNGKAYCVYEAESEEQVRIHAERARVPCDEISPVLCIGPDDILAASGADFGVASRSD